MNSPLLRGVLLAVVLCGAAEPSPALVGDCNGDGIVTINELITGVNIALGSAPLSDCPAFDRDNNGTVTITELIAAVNIALGGALPSTPTGSPGVPPTIAPGATPSPVPGSPTLTPDALQVCQPTPVPAMDMVVMHGSTADGVDHSGGAPCGWTKGGTGSPDVVYEYVAPADGVYDVRATGADFTPYLYVRRQSCLASEPGLGCADGSESPDGTAALAVQLTAGEPVAIVVDGTDPNGGNFTLQISRRLPDLIVQTLTAPSQVVAGTAIVVGAQIANQGDAPAGPFRVQFAFARTDDPTQLIGNSVTACSVSELGSNQVALCTPTEPLSVPLVAAGNYALIAEVDPDNAVVERLEDNNLMVQPATIDVRGALLEQQLLRAADGTAYQLIRAIPQTTLTSAEQFQITGVGGSSNALRTCSAVTAAPGGVAVAGVQGLDDFEHAQRTGILLPNDSGTVAFDATDSGVLTLGAGTGKVAVCNNESDCADASRAELLLLASSKGDIQPACIADLPQPTDPFPCGDGTPFSETVAFGLAATGDPPVCTAPELATISSSVCALEPVDGFPLLPGQAVVLVYQPGFVPFSTGVAAFGIDEDESNPPGCAKGEIVDAITLRADSAKPPRLTFVDAYREDSLQFVTVALSHDQRNIYAASDKSLFVFGASSAGGPFDLVEVERDGVDGITGLHLPDIVAVSPDDRYVYINGGDPLEGEDSFIVFGRDSATGRLSLLQILRSGIGLGLSFLDAPFSLSSDGTFAYLALTSGLEVLRKDDLSGRFAFSQDEVETPLARLLGRPEESPGGTQIYAPGDCITVFNRDPTAGTVTLATNGTPSCIPASAIAISPDGAQVYALNGDAADGGLAAR
jgi:CARDB